jgi:hypothetical protein
MTIKAEYCETFAHVFLLFAPHTMRPTDVKLHVLPHKHLIDIVFGHFTESIIKPIPSRKGIVREKLAQNYTLKFDDAHCLW